jgi:hypothetical protein
MKSMKNQQTKKKNKNNALIFFMNKKNKIKKHYIYSIGMPEKE